MSKNKSTQNTSNFSETNARLLLKKDEYYTISDIPKLLKDIDTEAGNALQNHMMKIYLDNGLSEGLNIFCENQELTPIPHDFFKFLFEKNEEMEWKEITSRIEEYENYEFWKAYIDYKTLVIHVLDIAVIFKKLKLHELSERIQLTLTKPTKNKISNRKRNERIIELYETIRKENPTESDTEIVNKIIEHVKNKQNKNKHQIYTEISILATDSIRDIISNYWVKLISPWKKNNQTVVQSYMQAIHYAEENKVNNKLPIVEPIQQEIYGQSDENMYRSYQKPVQALYS